MRDSLVLKILGATVLLGCGGEATESSLEAGSSAAISCKEACEVGNLSNNDLKARFGSTQMPSEYEFVAPYLAKGSEDFQRCIGEPGKDLFSAECTTRGLDACVQACASSR